MENQLLPGIVVLNRNYFPDSEMSAYKVGATHFALEIIKCLNENGSLLGIILYKRDETLSEPAIKNETLNGYNTITLFFNFRMNDESVMEAIDRAIVMLYRSETDNLIVYYHTDTIIQYHPKHIPACLTHHGPFVEDFIENYSLIEAYKAFESNEKVHHMLEQQKRGLTTLLSNENIFVLQHSNMQSRFLRNKGIRQDLIKAIIPPIIPITVSEVNLGEKLQYFLKNISENELILTSNAARIDYFKNMDLLIHSALELTKKNIPVKVIITGGSKVDEHKREALYKLIPENLRYRFMFTEKLSKLELYALFKIMKRKGIFVFTSRYETLGITPLEAVLSGVCTIMPDSDLVETSRFFPQKYKFSPSLEMLVDKLNELYFSKDYKTNEVNNYVGSIISEENFKKSFINMWSEITTIVNEKKYSKSASCK
ncbi:MULTISPECIES: glycosyltransferase [unclassified Paenibacillus]|uniref:glycosyltransferase n=1 Tax=unclassified Paenibacillus TaxID=185978 RepID=UPI0030F99C69